VHGKELLGSKRMKIIIFNRWIHLLNIMAFFILCGQTWSIQESPITLAKGYGLGTSCFILFKW
jgi:hypothetical protein